MIEAIVQKQITCNQYDRNTIYDGFVHCNTVLVYRKSLIKIKIE